MTNDPPRLEKPFYIRAMFARIAPRYELMNHVMTAGQDVFWRREVIKRAGLLPGGHLLDLGTGTGDLAREALRQQPECAILAADFTLEMMRTGQTHTPPGPNWVAADSLCLPLPTAKFDAVVSGFLLRNVANLPLALGEQFRVLKPGGRLVALDTTRPHSRSLLTPLIRLHMRFVIPLLGAVITGQSDAYRYLPTSSENFCTAETLAAELQAAGFKQVGFQRHMFGTIAIHWGCKP